MPDVSSADPAAPAASPRTALDVRARARLGMIVLGFIPAFHVAATVVPVVLAGTGRVSWQAAWLSPLILYLAPPVLARLGGTRGPLGASPVPLGSAGFLRWWYTAQWQVLFARLPVLEELLRLVPGLYSAWLRLWGARVGSLVYWSPGVSVLDRPLVRIGSRVVFGVGVRIASHVLAPDPEGRARLHVAAVSVGDDALVGAWSLLQPGCSVAAGEVTPPHRPVRAFSRFEGGRRRRGASAAPGGGGQ